MLEVLSALFYNIPMNPTSATVAVKNLAYRMGFDLVSVSRADPLEEDRARYQEWCKSGYAADLKYMIREAPRRWVPADLLPGVKSVVTFAVNFFSAAARAESRRGFGRVARYAWGKDYHDIVKARLEEWVQGLTRELGRDFSAKILVDSGPLLERAFAHESGLGFVGKNTVIISRKLGSFIFLSEVLTDLDLEPDRISDEEKAKKDPCGSCSECLADCPTNALIAPRVLDSRKCISYWTIENKGGIPPEMRPGIGDWIFGCDICQEVCPYKGLSRDTQWKEFLPEAGAGSHLSLLEILSMTDDAVFKERFAGTPLLRAKRTGLVRNACIVAANQNFTEALPLLSKLARDRSNPILQEHADWALNAINK